MLRYNIYHIQSRDSPSLRAPFTSQSSFSSELSSSSAEWRSSVWYTLLRADLRDLPWTANKKMNNNCMHLSHEANFESPSKLKDFILFCVFLNNLIQEIKYLLFRYWVTKTWPRFWSCCYFFGGPQTFLVKFYFERPHFLDMMIFTKFLHTNGINYDKK